MIRGAGAGVLLAATGCAAHLGEPGDSVATTPIAAGSTTSFTLGSSGTIDHAKSSDPSVLTVTGHTNDSVTVTALGKIGTATITAFDAANNALGTYTSDVAATTTIALDPGVTSGITVLVGEPHAVHATTIGADGVTLVGDGAIHFAYDGAISPSSSGDCFFGGDCGGFQFDSPGDGQVLMTATATTATATLALHAVTAIDTFTLSSSSVDVPLYSADAGAQSATVTFTILSGGVPVTAQVLCSVGDKNKVMALPSPEEELGAPGPETLSIAGFAVGSTTVTCTVGDKTATLVVNVK